MAKGAVCKILPLSSVDGPGNRVVIFLQGCNFNCWYCHNPETINHCSSCGLCIDTCPAGALSLGDNGIDFDATICTWCDICIKTCTNDSSPKVMYLSAAQTLKKIAKHREFTSGITVSGGECTLQLDYLTELFKLAKSDSLTTFADSNGSIDLSNKQAFLEVCDAVMLDVKAFDNEEHKNLTGKDNFTVLANLEFLAKAGKLFEVRTVVLPGLLTNEFTVHEVSKIIAAINPKIRYKLIKFRDIGVRPGLVNCGTPSDEYMDSLAKIACDNGCIDVLIV